MNYFLNICRTISYTNILMKTLFRHFLFIAFIISSILSSTTAQVSSTTANGKAVTAYSKFDTIFVFSQYPVSQKGSLTVKNPFDLKAPFDTTATFTWSRFDTTSNTFLPQFKIDTTVNSSTIDTLQEGGYRISLTKTVRDTSFIAWVYFNNFTIAVEKDSVTGEVKPDKYTCDYLDLSCSVTSSTSFYYKNPNTATHYSLVNQHSYLWTADPTPKNPLPSGGKKAAFRNYDPPYKDTHYKVIVTNLGLAKEDTVFYKSIQVKAIIEKEIIQKTKDDKTKNSAPVSVMFTSKSVKADIFEWDFGDGQKFHSEKPDIHVYYLPTIDTIWLIVESSLTFCVDSTMDTVVVSPPNIEEGKDSLFPNVFTPNGDGVNEVFKIYNRSIKQFKMSIFSRWGKLVYESPPNENMIDWEGWDGTIRKTGIKAPEGLYFYILDTTPFGLEKDPPQFYNKKGIYKGFFYLFRGI